MNCRHCNKPILYSPLVGWWHKRTKSIYCDHSGTTKAAP